MGDRFDQEDLVSSDMVIPRQRQRPGKEPQLWAASEVAALIASCEILEIELAPSPGVPWTVRCASRRYAILTRSVGMSSASHVVFMVIDWRNGLAGPCALIGGRWRDGTYSVEDCQLMLAALAGGVIAVDRALATPLQILHTTMRSQP